ncbi:MAG: hypothetical protein Ct9H300mP16_02680 [Pseudomonadota bacterium]|nr:MAG: hypothetical protein Ct9H300mP16_02680 [Pseudomonadota bacterium]
MWLTGAEQVSHSFFARVFPVAFLVATTPPRRAYQENDPGWNGQFLPPGEPPKDEESDTVAAAVSPGIAAAAAFGFAG